MDSNEFITSAWALEFLTYEAGSRSLHNKPSKGYRNLQLRFYDNSVFRAAMPIATFDRFRDSLTRHQREGVKQSHELLLLYNNLTDFKRNYQIEQRLSLWSGIGKSLAIDS